MQYTQRMKEWLLLDEDTKQELLKIIDEKELEDRFYKDLQFGTGGLRGIMGAGPNRMNKYTVGKATLELANNCCQRHYGLYIYADYADACPFLCSKASSVHGGDCHHGEPQSERV